MLSMFAGQSDGAQAHLHRRARTVELNRGEERCLAWCPWPAFATETYAVPVGVMEVHPTAQTTGGIALRHYLHRLVYQRVAWSCELYSDVSGQGTSPLRLERSGAQHCRRRKLASVVIGNLRARGLNRRA